MSWRAKLLVVPCRSSRRLFLVELVIVHGCICFCSSLYSLSFSAVLVVASSSSSSFLLLIVIVLVYVSARWHPRGFQFCFESNARILYFHTPSHTFVAVLGSRFVPKLLRLVSLVSLHREGSPIRALTDESVSPPRPYGWLVR